MSSAAVGRPMWMTLGSVRRDSAQVRHHLALGGWWDGRMDLLGAASVVPDPIGYLDAAAATPVGVEYKQRLFAALDVRAGHVVVDVGCGPGTDLARLADAVGRQGAVIGVDRQPRMVEEACRRLSARLNVACCVGDIHRLPLPGGRVDRARVDRARVDRARVDRVLQHVLDPGTAIAQLRRILRPGGLLGLAEPDWDTLAVADEDVDTSRRFARFMARWGPQRHHRPAVGAAVRQRRSARAVGRAGHGAVP